MAGDDTAVVDEETKRNKIIPREDGIASEDQKLDSATVSAETKQAKAPRSCHAEADAGCTAITTEKSWKHFICRTGGSATAGSLSSSAIDGEEQTLAY